MASELPPPGRWALPWAVLLGGVAFTIYLLSLTREGVFYSGDGGLKALMTRQLASGDLRLDLHLGEPAWVTRLWGEGLYPFQQPFVYAIDGRRYTQYPFPFPLLTAPLYALAGHRGLYVLPALSVVGLWLAFLWLCRRLAMGAGPTAFGLALLALGSPLSIYAAMFWEHTLSVFLAFVTVAAIFAAHLGSPRCAAVRAGGSEAMRLVLAGVPLGLAICFREEIVCLLAALLLAAAWTRATGSRGPLSLWDMAWLSAGTLAVVGIYGVANAAAYGHPLGPHAFQVVAHESFSIGRRLSNTASLLGSLLPKLLDTFPAAAVVTTAAALLRTAARTPERRAAGLAVALCVPFALTVPLLLPDTSLAGDGGRQWGARYYLPLLPLFCVATSALLHDSRAWRDRRARACAWILGMALLVHGVQRNAIQGAAHLKTDYQERALPLLRFLEGADGVEDVAVAHPSIAQEFMLALPSKRFFLTSDGKALAALARGLRRNGIDRFHLVVYDDWLPPERVRTSSDDGELLVVTFDDAGRPGAYVVYEAHVRSAVAGPPPPRAKEDDLPGP